MSYDHAMMLNALIRPEVVEAEVQLAVKPILDAYGYSGDSLTEVAADLKGDHEIKYDPETRELYLYTNQSASSGYFDVLEKVAGNLNHIVSEAGMITLSDHETADLENAISEIYFGPSPESVEHLRFELCLSDATSLLQEFIGNDGVNLLMKAAKTLFAKPKTSISRKDKNDVVIASEGKQREYRVNWEIDVVADNAVSAVKSAMSYMPHPLSESTATVFTAVVF